MTAFICVDDYLDPDVAYLLGLITARGQFHVDGDVRRLVINFPYRIFTARPPEGSKLHFDMRTEMRLCLDDVRNRINELLEVNVSIVQSKGNTQLVAIFTKNTMSWRNLTTLLRHRSSFREFEVPEVIYETPRDIQLEYARGFADASATPSHSDYEQYGAGSPKFHRIVLQVNHENWLLPIQICRLLQVDLGVPVQHILWGHPNLRDSGNRGKQWAKEHRIRIFSEEFLSVGFQFPFKQRILEAMAEINRTQEHTSHACNPLARHRIKKKPRHKDEKSKTLPPALRGKHFDAYFQICQTLGCAQGTPSDQLVLISEK